jgi:hypothetical protein
MVADNAVAMRSTLLGQKEAMGGVLGITATVLGSAQRNSQNRWIELLNAHC